MKWFKWAIMMKTLLTSIFIVTLIGCGLNVSDGADASTATIAAANNAFGLGLYSELARKPGNLVVSPFSTEVALAMAYEGAGGQTASEMAKTLGFPSVDCDIRSALGTLLNEMRQTNDLGCQLVIANSLWVQDHFRLKRAFKETVVGDFAGQINESDFAGSREKACEQINLWFKTQTHGRISEVIVPSSLGPKTDLLLANAAYFKGRWMAGFEVENTRPHTFQLDNTDAVSVSTMFGVGEYGYAETEELQILQMFYTDPEEFVKPVPPNSNRFSMVILLPKKIGGLEPLEHSLTDQKIAGLLNETAFTKVSVNLPKFSIGSSLDLKPALQRMGMLDAFLEDRADFSNISAGKPLFISFVCHNSWLRVDESGTEAAAGTLVSLTHGGVPDDVKVFNANHPFLFMVRDNQSGIILFLGRVMNPSGGINEGAQLNRLN